MSLRALFVGLGGVGQRHLRNLKTLLGDDLEPIAYRVRREQAVLTDQLTYKEGGNLERDFGLRVFEDLDAALEQRPHFCVIANPTAHHVPIAHRAVAAGADLFIEKPLSGDLHGIKGLIQATRDAERIAFVAYQLRFHPAVVALKQHLLEQKCGTLYGASAEVAEYLPHFHPYEDYRRMYASRKDLGGGVVLTQIHEIDLLYFRSGMPERVFGLGGQLSDLEIDVEDSCTTLLSFRRPDQVPWAATLHQDYLGRPPRRELRVWGSAGSLLMNLRAGTLDWTQESQAAQRLVDAQDYPRNQLFLDEMSHFLSCLRTRERPAVTLDDGAASLQVALAIKDSMRTGAPIQISQEK